MGPRTQVLPASLRETGFQSEFPVQVVVGDFEMLETKPLRPLEVVSFVYV
jgi:hypothetical protein